MEDNNNLGTEAVESPSTVEANVQDSKQSIADKYFAEEISDAQQASEQALDEVLGDSSEEETVVDESAGSEGNDDEISGDSNKDTEAEELKETEDGDHPTGDAEVDPTPDSVVDYNEMKNHVFEIDGQHYTADDIKSVFGQEKAAGTKSREASEQLKEIEAQKAELADERAKLDQRNDAAVASDEMVRMQSKARQMTAKIEKARAEGDMYEVTLLKDKMEVLGQHYNQAKQKVDIQNDEIRQQQIVSAEAGLKEKGLGYLLQDGKAADAWSSYVNTNLSETEANATIMSPGLAEMVEKARKWDNANKNAKSSKLKSSDKTLKAGSNKPVSSKKTKAHNARRSRIESGHATEADMEQTTKSIISKYFK